MNSLISKLLGTAVGVKIGNNTIIGLLVGVAWDENLQISELSLSPIDILIALKSWPSRGECVK